MNKLPHILIVAALALLVVGALASDMFIDRTYRGKFDISADTLNDTASGTGRAIAYETIPGFPAKDIDGFYGDIFLYSSPTTTHGLGNSDSGFIYAYTVWDNKWSLLASDSFAAIPCSLHFSYPTSTAGLDTLFKENIIFVVGASDSVSDTNFTAYYPVRLKFKLMNEE